MREYIPIWFNTVLSISTGATPDDPEKLVTPGIVWVNTSHDKFKDRGYDLRGGIILIGWWHYSIGIGIVSATKK